MLLFARPSEPASFAVTASPHRIDLESSREQMSFDKKEVWQLFKDEFFKAQHGKCGYCEIFIAGHPGAVEHYRPKGMVQALREDVKTWGREIKDSTRVRGRRPEKFSDSGYWWLAYEWSNYLLACNVCNSGWKRNIFPVAENPRPNVEQGLQETPLLLNPFGPENPVPHLSFDELGHISPRDQSKYGHETIRTCGLDRESLRLSRHEKAKRAHYLVEVLRKAESDRLDETLSDFYEMGREEYHHAGMVRSIFEELYGVSWEKLHEIVNPRQEES